MIEFDPPFRIEPFSKASPGVMLRIKDRYGFCAIDAATQSKMFVFHDASAKVFRQVSPQGDPDVFNFGASLIIAPGLDSFGGPVLPGNTEDLYIYDGAPKIGLDSGQLVRFFDLNSGELSDSNATPHMSRFSKWSLSARRSSGNYLPLIEIGGPSSFFG